MPRRSPQARVPCTQSISPEDATASLLLHMFNRSERILPARSTSVGKPALPARNQGSQNGRQLFNSPVYEMLICFMFQVYDLLITLHASAIGVDGCLTDVMRFVFTMCLQLRSNC